MRTGHAVRVAAITTAAIALVYVACVTAANLIVSVHLTAQTDARLTDRMSDLRRAPADVAQRQTRPGIDDDDDGCCRQWSPMTARQSPHGSKTQSETKSNGGEPLHGVRVRRRSTTSEDGEETQG